MTEKEILEAEKDYSEAKMLLSSQCPERTIGSHSLQV